MLSTSTRPTWVTLTLNWKCWQDAVELSKFSLNSTQLYHRLHQLKDCSARLDRSKCHSATTWVTVSMSEKLLPLKQITVYFKTGFYWHYYLCFSLMALILQFTFWCKLCVRLLVLLCLHFCVFLNMSLASTLGLAEELKCISKVSRITILIKCISIMIQFRSIIPNTAVLNISR